MNDFNRFMYDHSLHRRRKHSCRYCLHAFITEEILKIALKLIVKQTIKMPKKGEYIKCKSF